MKWLCGVWVLQKRLLNRLSLYEEHRSFYPDRNFIVGLRDRIHGRIFIGKVRGPNAIPGSVPMRLSNC
jgi:hypothetical protein